MLNSPLVNSIVWPLADLSRRSRCSRSVCRATLHAAARQTPPTCTRRTSGSALMSSISSAASEASATRHCRSFRDGGSPTQRADPSVAEVGTLGCRSWSLREVNVPDTIAYGQTKRVTAAITVPSHAPKTAAAARKARLFDLAQGHGHPQWIPSSERS
jgi:hypothetical protein